MTNRGNDRQDIFTLDLDWYAFERQLDERCVEYGVHVLVYAWMSNHFHMVVECADSSRLPDMMRDFQSNYSRAYNTRTSRTGSLFEKPYFSRPITSDRELLVVARYVHLNPVDVVGRRALPNYRWSSLGVYLERRRPPEFMDVRRLSGLIDPTTYLRDLARTHHWDMLPIGDAPPRRRTSLGEITSAVRSIGAGLARRESDALICHLALETRAADMFELAERLGVDVSTVRRRARSMRALAAGDAATSRTVERLLDRIASGPRVE